MRRNNTEMPGLGKFHCAQPAGICSLRPKPICALAGAGLYTSERNYAVKNLSLSEDLTGIALGPVENSTDIRTVLKWGYN